MEETIDSVMGFVTPYFNQVKDAFDYSIDTYGFWPTLTVLIVAIIALNVITSGLSGK